MAGILFAKFVGHFHTMGGILFDTERPAAL